jgi:hypothetical protein
MAAVARGARRWPHAATHSSHRIDITGDNHPHRPTGDARIDLIPHGYL